MDATDRQVALMEAQWPKWQIWVVRKVVGGNTWCARRWAEEDGRNVINAGTPGELAEYLQEAET